MSINENSEIIDVQQEQEHKTCQCPPELEHCAISIPSMEGNLIKKEPEKRSNVNLINIFYDAVTRKEEISISVPSPAGNRPYFGAHFIRKFNWYLVFSKCKKWLKHPMNIGFLIWFLCVGASLMMLGLLLIGALNKAFPTKSLRKRWIEINNQVLNGLFTLMSLFEHPKLFHHLFLLSRWRPEDVIELRKTYCKNGMYRPHEWAHITVVVVFFHVTCFSQYALCGLYWGYNSKTRPEFWENFFFVLGIAAPVFAGLYMVFSTLGREGQADSIEDINQSDKAGSKEAPVDLNWTGGLLDCTDDPTIWSLSFFCTCCMFGWNMQRLGFGNMFVHMFTFLLLCIAPFWVLNISALNISNLVLSDVIGYAGIFFCFYGLLYGGYWRIQMRKKLKLPGNNFCCHSASLTDYVQWLFCWSCALAQEIRTGNLYVEEEESLYQKLIDAESNGSGSSTMGTDESISATIAPVQPVITIQGGGEALVNIETISSAVEDNREVQL
jgi:Cys-rich protein (TIGR01571 family)